MNQLGFGFKVVTFPGYQKHNVSIKQEATVRGNEKRKEVVQRER